MLFRGERDNNCSTLWEATRLQPQLKNNRAVPPEPAEHTLEVQINQLHLQDMVRERERRKRQLEDKWEEAMEYLRLIFKQLKIKFQN